MIRTTPLLTSFVMLCLALALQARAATPEKASAPITPPGVHDYFNKLKALPELAAEYSLRDQAQIDKYRTKKKDPTNVTYDPANDTDPRKQDAAKIVIPAGRVSLPTQVRVPIPKARDGTMLITWDAWFGKEFAHEQTGIENYKNFQLASGKIYTEVRARFGKAKPPAIALVDVRQYSANMATDPKTVKMGPEIDGVKYSSSSLGPMLSGFAIMPETWTRYWVQFKPAEEGWFEFSLWMADENRDVVHILDGCRLKPLEDYWTELWLEYNTSDHSDKCPERVAYCRNIAMLKNVADPKPLFERPVGTAGRAPATQPAKAAE